MGVIYLFEHPGEDGGVWYAATFPLGATRYYESADDRSRSVAAYRDAIENTGGWIIEVQS